MTDEQLDKQIHDAYANVSMSPEAEERILANLLAAEKERSEQPEGEVVAFPAARRRRRPSWVAPTAIAAALLIGVFVGRGLTVASSPSADRAVEASNEAMSVKSAGEAEEAGSDSYDAGAGTFDSAAEARAAEIVLLDDGRRFAIMGVVPVDDPDSLIWEPAIIESTGDPCQVAFVDDVTTLMRFEGESICYLADELPD